MSRTERLPLWVFKLFHVPTHLYRFGFGQKVGPPILILTTTGRKSGLPRQTPLQYELIDGDYYTGSMRGAKADWYRNILADPNVTLTVGERRIAATAEAISDPEEVLAFLKFRLNKSPRMITAIMRADGLQGDLNDDALRNYAKDLTAVALRPSAEL